MNKWAVFLLGAMVWYTATYSAAQAYLGYLSPSKLEILESVEYGNYIQVLFA